MESKPGGLHCPNWLPPKGWTNWWQNHPSHPHLINGYEIGGISRLHCVSYQVDSSIFDWNENKTLSLFVFTVFEISFNFSNHPTTSDGPDIVFLTWERGETRLQDKKNRRTLLFWAYLSPLLISVFFMVLLPENNKEIAELRKTIKRKGRRILLHIIGKQFRMNKKYFHILSFHFVMTMFHTSYLGLMVVLTSWNEKLRQYVASNKDSSNHYVFHSFWCIGNILFCR